jgi:DNA-binding winged helix-turn-helix (wHTH) protein
MTVRPRIFRFDEFELDLGRYEVRRKGRALKLERVPMELLILLVEKEGQLVTREEIVQRLWGNDVYVDTRQGVNTAIRKIRLALGDDPDHPRILQTVVGKGYRLVAQLVSPERAPAPQSEPALPSTDAPVPEREAPSGSEATSTAALPAGERSLMDPRLARALLLFVEVGYLIMYGVALVHIPQIQRLGLPRLVWQATLLVALVGSAIRIYLASAVSLNYSGLGRLFRLVFPGILILDAAWAASPLLLFHKLGEFVLLPVAGLAFLPFSQRTLVRCAYRASGPQNVVRQ